MNRSLTIFLASWVGLLVSLPVHATSAYTFQQGQLSSGTYQLLRALEFPNLDDKEVLLRLQVLETKGILASRLGLDQHNKYHWFLERSRRSRIARQAFVGWKLLSPQHHQKNFSFAQIEKFLKVHINRSEASKKITPHIDTSQSTPRLKTSAKDILIGKWSEGPLMLQELKDQMLPEEWDRLLAFHEIPRQHALHDALKQWLFLMVLR